MSHVIDVTHVLHVMHITDVFHVIHVLHVMHITRLRRNTRNTCLESFNFVTETLTLLIKSTDVGNSSKIRVLNSAKCYLAARVLTNNMHAEPRFKRGNFHGPPSTYLPWRSRGRRTLARTSIRKSNTILLIGSIFAESSVSILVFLKSTRNQKISLYGICQYVCR